MTTYICTCGTSIITKRNIDFEKIKGIPLTQWEKYGTDIELIKEQVLSELQNISLSQDLNDTSAEIKSLIKMGLKPNDKVILISTYTIDGKLGAELVREFLISKKLIAKGNIQIKEIKGLQANDGKKFANEGIKNLLSSLIKYEYENIVLNITGGYKSVIPYLALIGMLFNKPIRYIHEDSEDIITLAHIPLLLNEEIILKVEPKLRKIEKETAISKEEWQKGIDYNDHRFDCLIEEENAHVTLSGIGFLFWERFKIDYPEDLPRDNTLPYKKPNGLKTQRKAHHGRDRIMHLADKVLQSPFVKKVLKSCEYQPKKNRWVTPLNNKEAEKYIQHPSESICIVTDIHSDAGYCFLIETTARNYDENKRIAEILERRYF